MIFKRNQDKIKYNMERISWDEYFSKIVKATSERSPCQRLQVGCLLVKDNRIISQGYNLSLIHI